MIGKHRLFRWLIVFTAVLGFALGGAVTPAAANHTTQHMCEDAGGTWDGGGDPDTGICYLPSSLISGFCPGYTYGVVAFFSGAVYAFGCGNSIGDISGLVLIPSIGATCIETGGLWNGDYAGENGTCTFPDGTDVALDDCGPGYDSVYTIVGSSLTDQECVAAASGGAGYTPPRVPGYGRFGSSASHQEGGGTLGMTGGKNGSVTFDPGTCSGKCTLGPNLPGGALASLPADAIAWLYFKSVDENGDPGTGTYTVCFDIGDLTSPVIYRYVSGAWVVVASTVSGGQVCTSASGDGAFALGGS